MINNISIHFIRINVPYKKGEKSRRLFKTSYKDHRTKQEFLRKILLLSVLLLLLLLL